MTFDQVVETIQEALLTATLTPTLDPATQVDLDNETFDTGQVPVASPWLRLTIIETASMQRTIGVVGNRWWERTGRAIAQCFAPIGTGGSKVANQLAESVRLAFEGKRISDQLWFNETTLQPIGPDGQAWFQVNVNSQFVYEHKH